jgi:hypothetical protein
VLVAAVGWAEGRRRAPSERSAIAACARQGEEASARAEERVAAMTSYVLPALGTRDRQLDRSMLGLISGEARRGLARVEEALAACRAVSVWWFNQSHGEARAAYVTFLEAQRERLREVERDGYAFAAGYSEVRRLAEAAEAAEARLTG